MSIPIFVACKVVDLLYLSFGGIMVLWYYYMNKKQKGSDYWDWD